MKIESKIKNLKKLKIVQRAALWYRGAFWQSQKSLTLNGAQWSGLVEMNQIGRVAAAVHFFSTKRERGLEIQSVLWFSVTQGQIAVVTATSNFRLLKCRIQAVVNFGTFVLIWDYCIHSTYLKNKKNKRMKIRLHFK